MIRIIDNKRIDLTDSEWKLYQEICESYNRPHFQGKDLFQGLFETDKRGRIIFLIPPKREFSFEVYMFLVNIMVHQHLGDACDEAKKTVNNLVKEARAILDEYKATIKKLKG